METSLPYYSKIDEINSVVEILVPKIKGATLAEGKKINNAFNENSLNAALYLGLVKENGSAFTVTHEGREYFQSEDEGGKQNVLRGLTKKIPIYDLTLEYLHHNKKLSPTKVEIGSFWNENYNKKIDGFSDDNLSSAVIFYFKFLDKTGLGKYVNAGRGRETHIILDQVELAKYVTSQIKEEKPKEVEPTVPKKQDSTTIADGPSINDIENSEQYISNLRALSKLKIELTWKELDSDGAKKLIIEKLDDLQNQNTVLTARVEKYQILEKKVAVLKSKVNSLTENNFFKTTVNSIGGIILGASFALQNTLYTVIGVVLGALLVFLSIFLREKFDPKEIDEEK